MDTFFRLGQSLNINDIVDNGEVQVHGVNGDLVFTRIILQGTGQETVSEEEAIDPEEFRNLGFRPCVEESQSVR